MFGSLILEAFISIWSNRLRTFLAMLGIVIGVSSVVALVAIGTGSSRHVEESIAKLGSNMLIVSPGSYSSKGITNNDYSELNLRDVEAIAAMHGVVAAAPSSGGSNMQVATSQYNWNTKVTGTSSDFFIVRDWQLIDGTFFTTDEMRRGARVAIVGTDIAKELFEGENPVGRIIRIKGMPFRIIGLLESKGQSLSGRNQDDAIYVPFNTMQRKIESGFFSDSVPLVFVKAKKQEWLKPLSRDIIEMLRERHKTRPAKEDPFSVRSLTSLTATTSQTTKALSYLLGAIASISLIVGGIGIMNIMLVTVTERTREIGIRKAIGATNRQVLWQFLLESIVISAAGSMIGLTLGISAALAVEHYFTMPAAITLWSVIIAITVAILVGILSGLYPAHRASKLQPIDALRQVGG